MYQTRSKILANLMQFHFFFLLNTFPCLSFIFVIFFNFLALVIAFKWNRLSFVTLVVLHQNNHGQYNDKRLEKQHFDLYEEHLSIQLSFRKRTLFNLLHGHLTVIFLEHSLASRHFPGWHCNEHWWPHFSILGQLPLHERSNFFAESSDVIRTLAKYKKKPWHSVHIDSSKTWKFRTFVGIASDFILVIAYYLNND